jgi:uncharacterized membrane protein YoaK (UPF0700 family)
MAHTTIREPPPSVATSVQKAGTDYGPLVSLLLAMTFVTGLVDAFSYLVLGHVFVANMTGNVVFLGFALAGAPDFSIADSVVALVAFGLGALVGGRLVTRLKHHRGRHLSTATSIQAALLAVSAGLVLLGGSPIPAEYHVALIVALGIAMGIQNATARTLAVPDLTTTVLTLTLTGLAADSMLPGTVRSSASRRLLAVAAMLTGAFVGAALLIHLAVIWPLVLALIIVLLVALSARALGSSDPAWVYPKR